MDAVLRPGTHRFGGGEIRRQDLQVVPALDPLRPLRQHGEPVPAIGQKTVHRDPVAGVRVQDDALNRNAGGVNP